MYSFAIHPNPLPYVMSLDARSVYAIDTVVIHCTELPDLATAREYGERALYDSGTGNSGHYYIDRDGRIEEYVAPARVAHHTKGWNPRSIGIELVNTGRYPDWLDSRHQSMNEPYSEIQITALIALLQWLSSQFEGLTQIAGHEDLDRGEVEASDNADLHVRRKLDPGPMFPWEKVLGAIHLRRL